MSTERQWVPSVGGRDTHFHKSNVQPVPYEEEEAALVDTEDNNFYEMNPVSVCAGREGGYSVALPRLQTSVFNIFCIYHSLGPIGSPCFLPKLGYVGIFIIRWGHGR